MGYYNQNNEGGLGLRDLCARNRASIYYQLWHLTQPIEQSILLSCVHDTMLLMLYLDIKKISLCITRFEKKNVRDKEARYFSLKLCRCSNFLFWHDPWVNRAPLLQFFDRTIITILATYVMNLVSKILDNQSWWFPSYDHCGVIEFRKIISGIQLHF